MADFKDVNGDSIPEFLGADWTFAYWKTSFAESPAPSIILRFNDGKFRLASDLMKENPPNKNELDSLSEVIRSNSSWGTSDYFGDIYYPSILWAKMLDLIYSGNETLAWYFFDDSWPSSIPGKNKF
ncbi:MAG: hypothetical protein HYZ34_10590 [Ignavibacteriae bacterium]|nr:hypothetical protein [Ignavibacteriota bacterium]